MDSFGNSKQGVALLTLKPFVPGSPEEIARLRSLWLSADDPCWKAGKDELRFLGVLLPSGELQCPGCQQLFVRIGSGWYHPDTPALQAALNDRRHDENSVG